jgi:hypothetical protein
MIAYLRNNIIEVLEVVTLKVYMWREKTEYCTCCTIDQVK